MTRWVWFVAWLPAVPMALIAVWMPAFAAPLLDALTATLAILAALVLVNLAAGRSRHDVLPAIAIVLTSIAGLVFAIFGPAFYLIAVNLSS